MRRSEISTLLFETPWPELRHYAARVLEREKGSHVFVRGLVEFSNLCRRNCRYCGLRGGNSSLVRYALSQAQVLKAASVAVDTGVDTIVLQSGEYAIDPLWLAQIIDAIRSTHRVPVTLSVGEQPDAAYALWKEAGAVRFLLKHETSDRRLYAALHPGHNLQERIDCLKRLAKLKYECGSGFMIGLPGQHPESLVDDILLARRLRVGMCGAGPFIPQENTPLGRSESGSVAMTLRVLAVLRIALPWANIPATTALATLDAASGQREGLLAGANVLMPGFTPAGFREHYRIYDNKNRVDLAGVQAAIEAAGRTHSLKPMGNTQCVLAEALASA
ncbi:[FeFe] hydrogenase H-cluster radical SAM maturase HydE [Desulfovibrio intestinalis]|uniref:Biotin synthase n=1 Tax=Desulfovibrio intestinalis TaxID=58621 RepID=A0A7W8C4P3_9BACT|nr:[FeFe] hydrogenase H-cluster radical SAM maturase HydE [Desulfovibrio intestinalis]MBB5143700.1 biotin synthase [Desulfovibrio intestinalis]